MKENDTHIINISKVILTTTDQNIKSKEKTAKIHNLQTETAPSSKNKQSK
jgi:hypothetical protein